MSLLVYTFKVYSGISLRRGQIIWFVLRRNNMNTNSAGQAMRAEHQKRVIRAPRGPELSAKSWQTEAPLRMLMNNLDPDVAERPDDLIVYGGIGKAARNWACFDRIVETLKELNQDETLLIQSGKPVVWSKPTATRPRVLIANSNLVPAWADWEHFNELDRKGLMMFGQMTAGFLDLYCQPGNCSGYL